MSGRWKCLLIPHALLMVLVLVIAQAPKLRPGLSSCVALLTAVGVIEGAFLLFLCLAWRRGESGNACVDIILLVWALLLVWELYASVWDRAHPVLVPAPEDVFDTFREQWPTLLQNVWHSLLLLAVGFSLGMYLAVLLGLVAGWYPRLRGFACPIANVMAPIPPVVFSPYLVALMPSFRSASALVIVLGVFWPTFLGTINRVAGIEPQLRSDTAAQQSSHDLPHSPALCFSGGCIRTEGQLDQFPADAELCRADGGHPRHGLLCTEQHRLRQLCPCGGGDYRYRCSGHYFGCPGHMVPAEADPLALMGCD